MLATKTNKNIFKQIQYTQMKLTSNLLAILVIALILSGCGKTENKPEESTKDTTAVSEIPAKEAEPEPQNFDDFWLEFQSAVAKKDKNKILEMCEFPMKYCGESYISEKDFLSDDYNGYNLLLYDSKNLQKLTPQNKYKFSKKEGNTQTNAGIEYLKNGDDVHKEKDIYKLSIKLDGEDEEGEWSVYKFFYFALRDGKYKLVGFYYAD